MTGLTGLTGFFRRYRASRIERRACPAGHLIIRMALLFVPSCGVLFGQSVPPGAGWRVPDAPCRLKIERTDEEKRPASTGAVRFWPWRLPTPATRADVYTAEGAPVSSQSLFAADGEPLQVLFEQPEQVRSFHVYLGARSPGGESSWRAQAGLVLETRPCGGQPVASYDQCLKAWAAAAPSFGQSLVPKVFEGLHLHGCETNVFSHYRGHLDITNAGSYVFATISTDASFVAIDGKPVAEWPNQHPYYKGRFGEFQGSVDLKPGRHLFEYYNAYGSARARIPLICVAAWRPGTKGGLNILPAEAFAPLARFRIAAFETAPPPLPPAATNASPGQVVQPLTPPPPEPYAEWDVIGHSLIRRDQLSAGLITMEFRARANIGNASFSWTFDDGTAAQGPKIRHVFPCPGLRVVKLGLILGGKTVASLSRTVHARPLWSQREDHLPAVFDFQKTEMLNRNLASMPWTDFISLLRMTLACHDESLTQKTVAVLLDRMREALPGDLEWFFLAAKEIRGRPYRQLETAERLFAAVCEWKSAAEFQPEQVRKALIWREKARLELAGLLINDKDQPREGLRLLEQINSSLLSAPEVRWKGIYEGDARLAAGNLDAARKAYLSVTPSSSETNALGDIRRLARLESARNYLERREFDEAERLLREIDWDSPVERMSSEAGLLRLELLRQHKEYSKALALCQRLLRVAATGASESWLLYRQIELNRDMGRTGEAAALMEKLMAKHPYSEAAARAKDKWGRSR
ncbi:MAG: hypothetical protein PHV34_05095 [Verrucomicrobiae bacterium]|nr:hypothetical protein [Verrucomicrobiae bacterium]